MHNHGAAQELSTFCHITEYGDAGYEALPAMVAASTSLTLWAPSSRLFASPTSGVSGPEFVELVRDGYVKVLARHAWIHDRVFRNEHPWPRASWDESIDGRLKAICDDDADRPELEQRVRIAPDEDGWAWAEKYIREHPEVVTQIVESYLADVPIGVLESAAREAREDPQRFALRVVRDARNHGQAFRISGARRPFFLSLERNPFIELIEDSVSDLDASVGDEEQRTTVAEEADRADEIADEIADRVLELLRHLSAARSPSSLSAFLRSGHRNELHHWMSDLIEDSIELDARNFDSIVLGRLAREVSNQKFKPALTAMFGEGVSKVANVSSLLLAMFAYAADPQNVLNLAGLATASVPAASGAARATGFIAADYDGKQWPYLFMFGRKASRRRHREMQKLLEEIRARPKSSP